MAKRKTVTEMKAAYRQGKVTYSQLMANVLANNSRKVAATVANISDDHYKKAISKKTGKIVLPRVEELIPRKSMVLNKTVQDSRLITSTLRNALITDLRTSLEENRSTLASGKNAGRVNPKLVDAFKDKITETFSNYVEENPRLDMPANIHTIAVGEVRSMVNQTKDNYTKEFVKQNPQFTMMKRWLHNPKLSRKPRPHHAEAEEDYVDGIPVNENFVLSTGVSLRYPHDPKAPIEEVAGCNCDVEYFLVDKDEEEQIQTGMWFLDSVAKNLQELIVMKAAAKTGEKRQRKDGVYEKQSNGSWLKVPDSGNTKTGTDKQETEEQNPSGIPDKQRYDKSLPLAMRLTESELNNYFSTDKIPDDVASGQKPNKQKIPQDQSNIKIKYFTEATTATTNWANEHAGDVDKKIIKEYTANGFVAINAYLRAHDANAFTLQEKEQLQEKVDTISTFLQKAPKFDGASYRGVQLSTEIFDGLKSSIGGEISFPSFVSTSHDSTKASVFAGERQMGSDKKRVLFKIEANSGVAIGGDLHHFKDSEKEVLFDRNSKFRIESHIMQPDGIHFFYIKRSMKWKNLLVMMVILWCKNHKASQKQSLRMAKCLYSK